MINKRASSGYPNNLFVSLLCNRLISRIPCFCCRLFQRTVILMPACETFADWADKCPTEMPRPARHLCWKNEERISSIRVFWHRVGLVFAFQPAFGVGGIIVLVGPAGQLEG